MKALAETAADSLECMRVWIASVRAIVAVSAGTYDPMCARYTTSATVRRKTVLPLAFGPVSSMRRSAEEPISQSLGTSVDGAWPLAASPGEASYSHKRERLERAARVRWTGERPVLEQQRAYERMPPARDLNDPGVGLGERRPDQAHVARAHGKGEERIELREGVLGPDEERQPLGLELLLE